MAFETRTSYMPSPILPRHRYRRISKVLSISPDRPVTHGLVVRQMSRNVGLGQAGHLSPDEREVGRHVLRLENVAPKPPELGAERRLLRPGAAAAIPCDAAESSEYQLQDGARREPRPPAPLQYRPCWTAPVQGRQMDLPPAPRQPYPTHTTQKTFQNI